MVTWHPMMKAQQHTRNYFPKELDSMALFQISRVCVVILPLEGSP